MKIKLGLGKLNMSLICKYCGGVLAGCGESAFEYICTDSREADKNTLFVATKGENVDGHDFMRSARERGCVNFLCERISDEKIDGANFCVVRNSIDAFADMARGYTSDVEREVVAITGSVGKTTTKNLVSLVLAQKMKLFATQGNYNSVIGMPMSLMSAEADCEGAVFEMGMSGFGEICKMSLASRPNIAMITNIGSSHLEYLKTRENIAKAKLEIADGLCKGGILLLSGDEPLLANLSGKIGNDIKVKYVSASGQGDFCVENVRVVSDGSLFNVRYAGGVMSDIFIPTIGNHIIFDACFAVAVGILSGLGRDEICKGLSKYVPDKYRQSIYDRGEFKIISDCYNASPESMESAIDVLCTLDGKRKVAVLGDMKELGDDSVILHRKVGSYLADRKVDVLFAVGTLGAEIARGAAEGGMNAENIFCVGGSADEIYSVLCRETKPGDVILFKASRAMRFEEITEKF